MPFANLPPKPDEADDGASMPRGSLMKHMTEQPDEEHEESALLEEAAAALEKDPAQADLVGRIRDCLAKHASGEYGGEKPGVAVVVAPKG